MEIIISFLGVVERDWKDSWDPLEKCVEKQDATNAVVDIEKIEWKEAGIFNEHAWKAQSDS